MPGVAEQGERVGEQTDHDLHDQKGDDEREGDLQPTGVSGAGASGGVPVRVPVRVIVTHTVSVPLDDRYCSRMPELTDTMSDAEMHDIGDRLVAAIAAGDADAVRGIYAPDAQIWHNFDQKNQSVDDNLHTLVDLHHRATGLQYTEIRRFTAPGGFSSTCSSARPRVARCGCRR